jgi:hypothetical protein
MITIFTPSGESFFLTCRRSIGALCHEY